MESNYLANVWSDSEDLAKKMGGKKRSQKQM